MIDVGIIDFGAGNIASVEQAVEYAGGKAQRVNSPEEILKCERLVLPGVGAAGQALKYIRAASLDKAIREMVLDKGAPLLGICLGMQMLADKLNEFGDHEGLGLIPGEVVKIDDLVEEVPRVPHMGWNRVNFVSEGKAFGACVGPRREFYFSHSYTFRVDEKKHVAALVDYPTPLVAAVLSDNIFATQFHPEKSQLAGDFLIRAFLNWRP